MAARRVSPRVLLRRSALLPGEEKTFDLVLVLLLPLFVAVHQPEKVEGLGMDVGVEDTRRGRGWRRVGSGLGRLGRGRAVLSLGGWHYAFELSCARGVCEWRRRKGRLCLVLAQVVEVNALFLSFSFSFSRTLNF